MFLQAAPQYDGFAFEYPAGKVPAAGRLRADSSIHVKMPTKQFAVRDSPILESGVRLVRLVLFAPWNRERASKTTCLSVTLKWLICQPRATKAASRSLCWSERMSESLKRYFGVPALVLGASGFLGRWVARGLTQVGARVTLAVRDQACAEPLLRDFGIADQTVEVDVTDVEQLRDVIAATRPAITFNAIGYGIDRSEDDQALFRWLNAELVPQVCRAVAASRHPDWPGCRIVHVGSIAEYGAIGGDLSEDMTPRPRTAYGTSKLAGTLNLVKACNELGIVGVAARVSTVYGYGEHPGRLLPVLLESARQGGPVELSAGAQKRDFIYAADVAEGLLGLGAEGTRQGEIINLATGRLTTVRTFAETAAGALDIPAEQLKFGTVGSRNDEESEHLPININKLSRMLSWSPSIEVAEGVLRTCKDLR